MKKYPAIIIDDEKKIQKVIQIKLEKFCPQIEIVGVANDVPEAFQMITALKPAIIFLDINMPKETGFDLLDYFDKINFEIIFATGYNDFAIRALRLSAVDYLLKPINTKLLIKAVQKAIDRIEERQEIERYKILKHNLDAKRENDKIAIPGVESYSFVNVNDIIRCEGWQNYTKIHLSNGNTIVSSYTIGVFKEMLKFYKFYTVHKSHYVNVNHILNYHKEGNLEMTDNSFVPISRRKKEDFMNQFIKKV